MKILLLDIYPDVNYRISKDQNGGYGTANDYGDSWFSKILKLFVKNSIDFPPLYAVQVCGELLAMKHEVHYQKTIKDIKDYDLIIMPSSIVCHETEIEIINNIALKKKIVVIGPFSSSNPENYIKSGAAVIRGEPEMFFHKIELENFINNFKPDLINNEKYFPLDQLSRPGWEIIFKNYVPQMKFLGSGSAITIYASKGCPYSCSYYCVYPLQQGKKLRLRSPKKVVDEMIYFYKNYNVKNFIFRDPVFSLDRKHTIEICNHIIESKIKFNICVETHLKNIDEELANNFVKSGIKLIYIGIESANEDVRKSAKRWSEKNDLQIKKTNYLEDLKIKIKAMYIIGLPEDTEEKYLNTIRFSKKINSSYAQFSVFTPYPGTPVYQDYKNKILATRYESFNQWNLVFKHLNFNEKKIRHLLDFSYKSYYLNFNWIIKYLKRKLI